MDEDDAVALALRRIRRRAEEADPQAGDAEHGGEPPEPRNHAPGERVEALRGGVFEPVDEAVIQGHRGVYQAKGRASFGASRLNERLEGWFVAL